MQSNIEHVLNISRAVRSAPDLGNGVSWVLNLTLLFCPAWPLSHGSPLLGREIWGLL